MEGGGREGDDSVAFSRALLEVAKEWSVAPASLYRTWTRSQFRAAMNQILESRRVQIADGALAVYGAVAAVVIESFGKGRGMLERFVESLDDKPAREASPEHIEQVFEASGVTRGIGPAEEGDWESF